MYGANVNLDENDNIVSVIDASTTLAFYIEACKQAGHGEPNVLVE
jgi:hypothetical protein